MARPATGKTPVRSVRIPDGLWSALQRLAKADGRSVSDLIVTALHRYVSAREREAGGPPTGEQTGR